MHSRGPANLDLPALLQYRFDAFSAVLESSGCDALVLGLWDNVRYASGWEPAASLEMAYEGLLAIVTRDGCHIFSLMEEQTRAIRADPAGALPHVRSIQAIPAVWPLARIGSEVGVQLGERLASLNVSSVGFDSLADSVMAGMLAAHPHLSVRCLASELFRARSIKHPEELRLLEYAAAGVDAAALAGMAAIRRGDTELEVAGDIARAMYRGGAEMISHVVVTSSTRPLESSDPRLTGGRGGFAHAYLPSSFPTTAAVGWGETARIDIGMFGPGGYCTDIARTAVHGEPSAGVVDTHGRLLEVYEHMSRQLAPGLPLAEHDREFRSRLHAAGFPDYRLALGHGIGMRMVEPPSLTPGEMLDSSFVYEEGMVCCLEVHVAHEGHPVSFEDMYAITAGGPVRLNRIPYDL